MSNNFNLTIELGPESQAKLDKILEALQGFHPNCHSCVESAVAMTKDLAEAAAKAETPETAQELQEAPKAEAPEITHPVEEDSPFPEPLPAAPAEEEKPSVTPEQLQQKVVQLAAANNGAKKARVREIVNAYARKVSDIPEDKRAEVWDKLTQLESEV